MVRNVIVVCLLAFSGCAAVPSTSPRPQETWRVSEAESTLQPSQALATPTTPGQPAWPYDARVFNGPRQALTPENENFYDMMRF